MPWANRGKPSICADSTPGTSRSSAPVACKAWFPDQLAPRPAEHAVKRPKTAKFAGSQRRDHVKYPVPLAFRRKRRSCGRR